MSAADDAGVFCLACGPRSQVQPQGKHRPRVSQWAWLRSRKAALQLMGPPWVWRNGSWAALTPLCPKRHSARGRLLSRTSWSLAVHSELACSTPQPFGVNSGNGSWELHFLQSETLPGRCFVITSFWNDGSTWKLRRLLTEPTPSCPGTREL